MKGSPMQRNFGIGSPMRQDEKTEIVETVETTFTESELENAKKVKAAGKKGYAHRGFSPTDQEMKDFHKVYGESANPHFCLLYTSPSPRDQA